MEKKKVYRLIVCGPSAVGKGTVIVQLIRLLAEMGKHARLTVSHTTRDKRPGEVEGVHYHFRTNALFSSMLDEGQFAERNEYSGKWYGTTHDELLQRPGDDLIITEVDVKGADQLRHLFRNEHIPYRSVFILPEGQFQTDRLASLRKSLERRGVNDTADMERRLATASREIQREQFQKFHHWTQNPFVESVDQAGLKAAKVILSRLKSYQAV